MPADEDPLATLLRSLGASHEELAGAQAGMSQAALAVALVLRRGGPPVPLAEAAAAAGGEPETFGRFWRALGFAGDGDALVPADVVATLPVIANAVNQWLGEETALGIGRVVGSAAARIAESLVDGFRVQFEVPELSGGADYADVVKAYVDIVREGEPAFEEFVTAVLRAHLVRAAAGAWLPDPAGGAAARRELFVGFVDLVGYTALARTLSPADLGRMLGRFEEAVSDIVAADGGRLVKQIGDGAMFSAVGADAGCRIALALSARFAADAALPPVRVGADFGEVLAQYGDFFGDVVNRAARLVALARPSTVVVTDTVAGRIDRSSFGAERLPPQALKGFHAPAATFRLQAR